MPRLVIRCSTDFDQDASPADVTIEIHAALKPTVVGLSRTRTTSIYTNPQYRKHFDLVTFDRITPDVIQTREDCDAVLANITMILTTNGRVAFRSGRIAGQFRPILKDAFQAHNFVVEREAPPGAGFKPSDEPSIDDPNSNQPGESDHSAADEPLDIVFKRGAGSVSRPR